jgi:DMSO/TMAO reductase YedYZ molybdopterin-dependent catalytic subunit
MAFSFPGRKARPDRQNYGNRLPPGQRVVEGSPVRTQGAVPRIDLNAWTFRVWGEVEEELTLGWQEFMALPKTTVSTDAHCVEGWSIADNTWEGVAFREVMKRIRPKPDARYVMVHSYGGYTTNVSLEDLLDDSVLVAYKHNGEELTSEHGWPLRLVVPKLYFWKSVKWVHGLCFMSEDRPGFWEGHGYHHRGDVWQEERYSQQRHLSQARVDP